MPQCGCQFASGLDALSDSGMVGSRGLTQLSTLSAEVGCWGGQSYMPRPPQRNNIQLAPGGSLSHL